MAKYLDSNGLQHLWDRIKSTFVSKQELIALITPEIDSAITTWEQKTTSNDKIDTFKEIVDYVDENSIQQLTNADIDEICQ